MNGFLLSIGTMNELDHVVPGDPDVDREPHHTLEGAMEAGAHHLDTSLSWNHRLEPYESWFAYAFGDTGAEIVVSGPRITGFDIGVETMR